MSRQLRLSLSIGCLLIGIGTAWKMFSLNGQDLLWRYWSIPMYLGFWFGLILLLNSVFYKHASRFKLLGLATLSGVLLGLSFPPLPFTPLIFIGFVPLLIVENEIAQHRETSSKWAVFKYAYHTFFIWNVLATYWVTNTALVAGLFAIFVNALLMCIPFVLFHQAKKTLEPKFAMPAFIVYWIAFEFLHMDWELSWTWLTLGNSFAEYPSWVQWYEFTGVFGGTFWVLLANVLFYGVAKIHLKEKGLVSFRNFIKPFLLVVLPILVSVIIYTNYEDQGKEVEVVIVQPNYEPHYEKFDIPQKEQIKRFIKLSRDQVNMDTDYLLFPETSFGGVDIKNPTKNTYVRQLQDLVNENTKLNLVMGVSAQRILKEGDAHHTYTRTHKRANGEIIDWESFNAAIQISSGQEKIPVYLKSILVPGAESFPYRNIFSFAKPLVDKLGGSMGLGMQEERSVFFSKEGWGIAPVICYESVYGAYCTDYISHGKGANALFIVTNDGWWDNTAGHQQHLQYASLRAIETRRSIARSANTGISAFINQRGDIQQPTSYGETIAIKGNIALNNKITFYTHWKDLLGRLSIFMSLLMLLNTIVKGVMKRKEIQV